MIYVLVEVGSFFGIIGLIVFFELRSRKAEDDESPTDPD